MSPNDLIISKGELSQFITSAWVQMLQQVHWTQKGFTGEGGERPIGSA